MSKKSAQLDTDEALRRTDVICSLLAEDTWVALRARVAFEAANDVLHRDEFDRPTGFADTCNVVTNSILLAVALDAGTQGLGRRCRACPSILSEAH